MAVGPMIEITDCRLCGWGLRAGWMAQELLTTFAEELGSVTLTPDGTGGVFEVRVNNEVIWSRSGTQRDQTTHPRPRRPRSLARAYGRPPTTLRDCRQNRILLAAHPHMSSRRTFITGQARFSYACGTPRSARQAGDPQI